MEPNKDGTKLFNKLDANDVWKNFNCPKYITRPCPKTDKLPEEFFHLDEYLKVDTNYILQKLNKIISDPIVSNSVPRICRLLYDYLHEKIKDLPLVIKILKFLAENVQSVKEYQLHFDRMLELCNLPPLLERSSEGVVNSHIIEEYFTLLGDLLVILPLEQAVKVHKALHSLLVRTKLTNVNVIKLKHCREAMEKSKLPLTVVELLQASSTDMYPKNLELVFLLSSTSHVSSHRMLEASALNTILVRMDLPYATQLRCTRPPDSLLIGNEYTDDTNLLIINTIWSLIKSIIPPNGMPINMKGSSTPAHCVLWGLCYAFKRQLCYSQYRCFNKQIRNEIATIIFVLVNTFPSWNFVGSGIADTVIKYLVGVETGTARVFSETVKFGRTNEDFYFEKILLLIVTQLAEVDACIFFMEKRNLMEMILQLVNPNIEETKIHWNSSQFWYLWLYAINALSVLAPKMPQQFLDYDGSIRLYMILDWCLSTKFNIKIVMACIRTICTIVLSDNVHILEYFREYGIILLLIKLINCILKFEKITMKDQRALTLALISIERLMRKQMFYQEMYGEYSVTFIMELLFRCLYQKGQEFQIDQRLLLAIGSYIWECIIWCPKNLEKFIEYGGVYILLDIIEIAPYCSQCLFLAMFTDMCENIFCGTFLSTWRGIDKKTGVMALLAKVWREEEIRLKVERNTDDRDNTDDTTEDVGLPQMGQKQWLDTYATQLSKDISPAINDMIGSVRSKIYSICKIIERDNERYEIAKERYKILYADLSMEDRITVSSIELYFILKLGQVWVEITKYFEHVGITPLGMDGQALFLMVQRYYLMGSLTRERHDKIIQSIKTEEEIKEKDEYARIRDSKLIIALDAFDELDYICRTADRSYMLQKKNKQIQQVNLALKFPHDSDDAHCHRTFSDKIMVTTIFNQHQRISTGLQSDSHLSQMKMLPLVSPCDSHIFDIIHYSDIPSSCSSNTCITDLEVFVEDE
ncbi:Cilia- and flagella-associated protein 69 [Anthophora retusa]